jgi:hypothetical protein
MGAEPGVDTRRRRWHRAPALARTALARIALAAMAGLTLAGGAARADDGERVPATEAAPASVAPARPDREKPPTRAEMEAITRRGRELAEYDAAAWIGTDVVRAQVPEGEDRVRGYVARRTPAGWVVAFGRFDEQKRRYLIAYEARQQDRGRRYTVVKHEPPRADTGFFVQAARALELARGDFEFAPGRSYNVAVLPGAGQGALWVYLYPAPRERGIWPVGADARYRISADGRKILEKRRLHRGILEVSSELAARHKVGFFMAVLDVVPEDTDVFHVLQRSPRVPQVIGSRQFYYRIETDGRIRYLGTARQVREGEVSLGLPGPVPGPPP